MSSPYHVVRAVPVVVALAAKVVEADADSAELLVADAVVPVHLALPPPHAPPEGDPRAPGGRFSREKLKQEGISPTELVFYCCRTTQRPVIQ